MSAAGEEQCEAGARETGSGSSLAPDRAAPAGGDQPAAGAAASDPGGPGRVGRFRLWRELGGRVREIGGAIRGDKEVLGRFRAELEDRLRWERVSLGKEHSEAVRGIESKAGEFYREGLEGSEKRAREAARADGLLLDSYRRPDEFYRLKYSMLEERLEQVREIDGELAY